MSKTKGMVNAEHRADRATAPEPKMESVWQYTLNIAACMSTGRADRMRNMSPVNAETVKKGTSSAIRQGERIKRPAITRHRSRSNAWLRKFAFLSEMPTKRSASGTASLPSDRVDSRTNTANSMSQSLTWIPEKRTIMGGARRRVAIWRKVGFPGAEAFASLETRKSLACLETVVEDNVSHPHIRF